MRAIRRVSARPALAAVLTAAIAGSLAACGPREPARIEFEPVGAESGFRFRHELPGGSLDNLAEAAMGGFGLTDLDGDGRPDVFCVNGGWNDRLGGPEKPAKTPHHRLFRNLGGMRFEDVSEAAGVAFDGFGMGVAVGDIEGDGKPDLFVSQYGPQLLLRNRGDGTFEDVAERAGIAPFPGAAGAAGAAFLDYDRDGDLDLFVGAYVDIDQLQMEGMAHGAMDGVFPGPGAYRGQSSRLYRNRGDGTFEDVSAAAGIVRPGKAMGVAAADFDGDGWQDLVVANDAMANFVWRNRGDGTFVDAGATSAVAFGRDGEERASMGVTFADGDGDGKRDLFIPDTRGGAVYWWRNPWFSERSAEWGLSGMSMGHVGWCDARIDADLDGLPDVYRVHGDLRSLTPQPCFLVRGFGGGRFDRVLPGVSGPDGIASFDAVGRSALAADLDGDGREDLVVSVLGGTMRVFRNVTERGGNWVRIRLAGRAPNPLAIGAVVTGRAGARKLVRAVESVTSYISAPDLRMHFGLGDEDELDDVVVRWPDGTEQRAGSLDAGREHVIERR